MSFRLTSILKLPLLLPLAAIIGAINVFAFAPFGLWPIQLLTLALFVFCLMRVPTIKHGALLGWAYGFGWVAYGVHWIYISLHDYGALPGWMAALAVALLACLMGLYTAICAAAALWLQRRWSA